MKNSQGRVLSSALHATTRSGMKSKRYWKTTCLLVILGILALTAGVSEGARNGQRNRRSRNDQRTKHINKGATVDCFQALKECRKGRKCRRAYDRIDSTCKVTSGRCAAGMSDIPRCGEMMDQLFATSFTENRCRCADIQNLSECLKIVNKVYANPCFDEAKKIREKQRIANAVDTGSVGPATSVPLSTSAPTLESTTSGRSMPSGLGDEFDASSTASINHLRSNNVYPKEVNAYDKVSGYVPAAIPPSLDPPVVDIDEISIIGAAGESGDYVFGDAGFQEPPSSNRRSRPRDNPRWILEEEEVTEMRTSEGDVVVEEEEEILEVEISIDLNDTESVTAGYKAKAINMSTHISDVEEEKQSDEEFKIIAIILGVLLGMFLLSTIIFFAWIRARGSFAYTKGKCARDHRNNEGIRANFQHGRAPKGIVSGQHHLPA